MNTTEHTKGIRSGARTLYGAVLAIFIACLAAGFVVVFIAANEAENYASATEKRLVQAELLHLSQRAIREQAEISYWDEAMQSMVLGPKPSKGFAKEHFSDWLIPDMGFAEFVLVDPRGQVKMVATPDGVNTSEPTSELAVFAKDLVQVARTRYEDKRYKLGSKYLVDPEDGNVVPDIQAVAFRNWQGKPSLIVAQVMIAETRSYAAGSDEALVLLSSKPLSSSIVSKSMAKLGIADVFISPVSMNRSILGSIDMPDMARQPSLAFNWTPVELRSLILEVALPIGAIIAFILAVFLAVILRHNAGVMKELAQSEQKNKFLATHDKLTGLANREKFERVLDSAFYAEPCTDFAIMFIDLDKFKQANDTCGHHAGDYVLKTVAQRLQECIADNGLVARVGGDEFVILFTSNKSEDELRWVADDLIESCSEPIRFENTDIQIGASVGIALAPRDGSSADEIMKAADSALYQSKRSGRGRASVWKSAA